MISQINLKNNNYTCVRIVLYPKFNLFHYAFLKIT